MKSKFLILGGGISGLSAAWFLQRKYPEASITLLEKTHRLGGWIETERKGGFLFEKGPRTFPLDRSPLALQLIRDLGLEKDLIYCYGGARYLWHRGRLRSIGSLIPSFFPAFVSELFVSRRSCEDESIYDFALRRFNRRIAETLFDPLALGIYGGDIRKLSIRSCFPKMFEWEQTKGSVVRGLFSGMKGGPKGLFTLRNGMETLIEALQKQLRIQIIYNTSVEKIENQTVFANGKTWQADLIFSSLPNPAVSKKSLWVVQLVFEGTVLSKKGFGYLVPSQEGESLLGMIWDSSLFPEQNRGGETRLTAMVRSENPEPLACAIEATKRHLGIRKNPLYTSAHLALDSIPQFEVGHWKKISSIEESSKHLILLGNYFENPSVESCIQRSFKKINL